MGLFRGPYIVFSYCYQICFQGCDFAGHDLHCKPELANDLEGLIAHANSLGPVCQGFNTNGWFKTNIAGLPPQPWTNDPMKGVYRRVDPTSQQNRNLPGWEFIQGVDYGGNDICGRADLANNIEGLVMFASTLPDCVGFNTNGCFKRALGAQSRWTSEPHKGFYRRVVAPSAAPVNFPGWEFIQGVDYDGNDICGRADLANNIQGLMMVANSLPDCVGFNTNGCFKRALSTQSRWTSDPNKGFYRRVAAPPQAPMTPMGGIPTQTGGMHGMPGMPGAPPQMGGMAMGGTPMGGPSKMPISVQWTQLPGRLSKMACGGRNLVFGVQENGTIWRLLPGANQWQQVFGNATEIAVGSDGQLWVIHQGQIYRWTGGENYSVNAWQQVPGTATKIVIGSTNNIVALNGTRIFKWTGNGWNQLPGEASNIAAAADGTIWVVGTDKHSLYKFTGSGWEPIPCQHRFVEISMGSSTCVVGITHDGKMFKYLPTFNAWQPVVCNQAKDVAIGADGTVVVCQTDGDVFISALPPAMGMM